MPTWAGGWDHVYGQSYAPLNEPNSIERSVARLMAAQGNIGMAAVGVALTGAAVGATATASYTQITAKQADGFNLGGKVDIAPRTVINRPTTAADEQRFDAQLQPKWAPTTYPPDLSGNGGGGKLGTL